MSISWRILIKYMTILLRSRFNEYKVFYSTPMTVVNEHIKKLFVWGLGIIEASSRDFSMGNWLTAYGQQKFCGIFFFINIFEIFWNYSKASSRPIPLLPPHDYIYWLLFLVNTVAYLWMHIRVCYFGNKHQN